MAVLKILPLRQHIGSDKDVYLVAPLNGRSLALIGQIVGMRRESTRHVGNVLGVTRGKPDIGDPCLRQSARYVAGSVAVLRENQHLFAWVLLGKQVNECIDLGVPLRVPVAKLVE